MVRVNDHRRPIPTKVKLEVLILQAKCPVCEKSFDRLETIHFDHRPALAIRPFDPIAGDFEPPQRDPRFIEAVHQECHLFRTTGRRPGAERTVTTAGSDACNMKKVRRRERAKDTENTIPRERANGRESTNFDERATTNESTIPAPSPFKRVSKWKQHKRKIPSRPFPKRGARRKRTRD